MRSTFGFLACIALIFVVGTTCIRIEYLNMQVDGFLPRTDVGGGIRKWRFAAKIAMQKGIEKDIIFERIERLRRSGSLPSSAKQQQEILERPFSAEELATIEERVKSQEEHQQRMINLYQWVSTMGLFQYILAPIALVWALYFVSCSHLTRYRLASGLLATVAAASIILMLYRGYYTSLGW